MLTNLAAGSTPIKTCAVSSHSSTCMPFICFTSVIHVVASQLVHASEVDEQKSAEVAGLSGISEGMDKAVNNLPEIGILLEPSAWNVKYLVAMF